ncbi:excalibur calcium-binding domain-containing protein [Gephyromycinifex aptenodytis]|uniref:excalibur calcium-binding domain-containing protein n=1 Tax=Gephyromycinifex aptenodytis TaxID=2716227 RepID=UPI001B2FF6AC|nr:excalibur calcium-binding domain-containing protein [Gephyromycinifex aptenodytis]
MSRRLKLAMVAVLAVSPMVVAAPSAQAAPSASKYKNCAALNRVYPNGVGKKGAVDKTSSTRVRNFKVDTALYNSLPKTLDRDRDGIACEKLTKGASAKPKKAPAKPKPAPAKPKKAPAKPKPAPAKPKKAPAAGKTVSSPGGFAFVTPSGNVACLAGPSDVRCDINQFAYVLPTRPSTCELEYGQAFELRRTAAPGCISDTLAGTAFRTQNWFRKSGLKPLATQAGPQAVLPYGWKLNSTQISCTSATTGVTCINTTTRHGFTLAKAGYRIF